MVHIYNVSFDYCRGGKTFEYCDVGSFTMIRGIIDNYLAKGFSINHLTLTRSR